MIIIDANIIAYLFLPEYDTKLSAGVFKKAGEWGAPLLWRSEFRSILTRHYRNKKISFEETLHLMQEVSAFMYQCEYPVSSNHVLNLVRTSNCSSYDCEYVALAEEFNVPLVTADKKILKEFPERAISPEQYIATYAYN